MDFAGTVCRKETVATYFALSGLREALFGNTVEARGRIHSAMEHSIGRDVQYGTALALAYAKDNARVQTLINDLAKRFPEDTIVQFNYLPTLRATLAISKGNAAEAVENLRAATSYELGMSTSSTYGWTALYPVFVRGEAYLAAHQGAEAAAEFQKSSTIGGLCVTSIGALAHLGLARAYALQGDTVRARGAYQDFLALWKEADTDIPVLLAPMPSMQNCNKPISRCGTSP